MSLQNSAAEPSEDDAVDAGGGDEDDSGDAWPQLPQLELDVCLAAKDTQLGLLPGRTALPPVSRQTEYKTERL